MASFGTTALYPINSIGKYFCVPNWIKCRLFLENKYQKKTIGKRFKYSWGQG